MKILKPSLLDIWILSKLGKPEYHKRIPLNSLIRQFVEAIYIDFSGLGTSIRDTSNVLRSVSPTIGMALTAGATVTTYGIRVGTSTQAVSISDYNLITPIAHGNAAGQLYHQATTVSTPTIAGSSCYVEILRNFNNNSGGTITVQEVGLIAQIFSWYFLLARDITGPIDIPNTKTLAALYTFKVTA